MGDELHRRLPTCPCGASADAAGRVDGPRARLDDEVARPVDEARVRRPVVQHPVVGDVVGLEEGVDVEV